MAVAVGFVVVSGALLLWLLAMVRQASRVLPPGSPVPVHGGAAGWNKWRPKESALRAWGIGAACIWVLNIAIMICVVTIAAAKAPVAVDIAAGGLVIPMIIFLVSARLAFAAARAGHAPGSRPDQG